ncbi:hypothetical protein ABT112_04330 [Streptomyces sp. NPDC002055]|uniref:DUF6895 family protein n=1 Tax=Streptomyces sp. NPDC002055 TaxID=3154534 RepID=UPI00332D9069
MDHDRPGRRSSSGRAVEERAVAWLAARRTLIDPGDVGPDEVLFVRKALIETAFLVGLRARLVPSPLENDYASLLEQIRHIAARPSYRELIARDEDALLLYAGTYAALRLCGFEDPDFRHLVEQAAAGGYATAFERIPYRQLDLLHTLEVCGIEHTLPAMDDVLPFSLLCNRPNVLKLTDRDIYAVTHTVFYVTDFGLRRPRWPRGFAPGEAVELLDALLVVCRARRNADLVGELLCCLLCLGVKESPAADEARQFLAAVQEPDGRVNGPSGIVHPHFADSDPEYRRWADGYHTTIVAALAGLLDRSPDITDTPPPPAPPAGTEPAGPLRRAVAWLAGNGVRHPVRTGLPAVAAAACGASALGEPELAVPALRHFADRLADAGPEVWQEQGMEVAGEFAVALRASGAACPSLERFLGATAAVIGSLDAVPADAAENVRRLAGLGLIDVRRAAKLTGGAAAAAGRTPEACVAELLDARRTYHLGKAAHLLRELVRAGHAGHRLTRDLAGFLLAQQHPDGGFGYPACDDPGRREECRLSWTRSIVTALAGMATSAPGSPGKDLPAGTGAVRVDAR